MSEEATEPVAEKSPQKSFLERVIPMLLVLTVGLAFAVGILWQKVAGLEKGTASKIAGQATQAPQDVSGKLTKENAEKIPAIGDKDHLFGSKDAQVKLIVYTDLECPFCKTFHATAKQAIDEYQGKVAMVFRNFPLDAIHSNARAEAEAAECVAKLGGEEAFQKYIDKIFAVTPSNNGLDQTLLPTLASQLEIKLAEFNSCVSSGDTKNIVDEQAKGGEAAGVTGTPGVFVINQKGDAWLVPGAVPLANLKQTIDEALK